MMKFDELKSLKVGDKVGMRRSGNFSHEYVYIAKVKRLTKTQIIVERGVGDAYREYRFKVSSGHEIGDRFRGFNLITLEDARNRIAELKAEQQRRELIEAAKDFRWQELTTEQLREVVRKYVVGLED